MTALRCQRVTGDKLAALDLELPAGLNVVLGTTADGIDELARLLLGVERPRRGSVRVAGEDPHTRPTVRARVAGVLESEPPLPLRGTARDVLDRLLVLAGERARGAEALAEVGLSAWASRDVATLTALERRSLSVAAVAAREAALAVVVVEPRARLPGVDLEAFFDLLVRRAEAGASVVVATGSPSDAARFAPRAWLLESGAVTRQVSLAEPDPLARGGRVAFVIRAGDPRALVEALTASPAVTAVRWEGATTQVLVEGADALDLGRAVLRASVERGVRIEAMEPRREGMETLAAVTAALGRVAYEAAYQRGRGAS